MGVVFVIYAIIFVGPNSPNSKSIASFFTSLDDVPNNLNAMEFNTGKLKNPYADSKDGEYDENAAGRINTKNPNEKSSGNSNVLGVDSSDSSSEDDRIVNDELSNKDKIVN